MKISAKRFRQEISAIADDMPWKKSDPGSEAVMERYSALLPEINQVLAWLGDEESRRNYYLQFKFLIVNELFGRSKAVKYCAGLPEKEYQSILESGRKMIKNGQLPDINFRGDLNGVISCMSQTFLLQQYKYKEIVKIEPGDIFLDCGACFGDTAIWAARQGAGTVYAFEPDPLNYEILLANIKKCAPDKIVPLNKALGEGNGRLSLLHNPLNCGASSICEIGSTEVEALSIDQWRRAEGLKADFIKMDLEGYEPWALRGARETIAGQRPKLAVSIYHKDEHLWTLPAMIKEMREDYVFYYKKSSHINEYVLFAA